MKPYLLPESPSSQTDLFKVELDDLCKPTHQLRRLADVIDWEYLNDKLGNFYIDKKGRPGVPTRLMVGLIYLKNTFNLSDESAVARLSETPSWQYFCGFFYFQHEISLDASSLSKWRRRVGEEGMDVLLRTIIMTAQSLGAITRHDVARVNVDTTVQDKEVTFPTDAKLRDKAREVLVREAKKRGIKLQQSYVRVGKKALRKASYPRAKKVVKDRARRKLKTYLGRVIRDIWKKCPEPDAQLLELLQRAEAIRIQERKDKNKVYSMHAPEVECISKGKPHKKYEFGCKVSVVTTAKKNWVLSAVAYHGNPYDGATLISSIEHAEKMADKKCQHAFVDRGYRGEKYHPQHMEVHVAGDETKSRALQRWMKRREAIEPVIGHLKQDNRLNRNHLKGALGDKINPMLAACGFNILKLLRWLCCVLIAQRIKGQKVRLASLTHW